MPGTPAYNLRYPALSNTPNVPQDMQNLAEDVEDEVERVDAKFASLAAKNHRVDTQGTTGSTAYTGTLTGASVCGIDFVAPASGTVTIYFATAGFNTGGGAGAENKTSIRVGTGSVVGAGTQVWAPNDTDMILHVGEAAYGFAGYASVPSLTPGVTYNVQLHHKVSAGVGSWLYRRVKVFPDV